jgi:hypothetical protein
MDKTFIIVAVIFAISAILIIILLRDRLTAISVDGSKAKIKATMEAKKKSSEIQDEKPVNVVFKGNKVRGEGNYRMRSTEFSENDLDGKQKLELGYDDERDTEIQSTEKK